MQGEEDCFIGECFFDQRFKFRQTGFGSKTVEGVDSSLVSWFDFPEFAPLVFMYLSSESMFVQWEEASSQNKFSGKGNWERIQQIWIGGTDFNVLNFMQCGVCYCSILWTSFEFQNSHSFSLLAWLACSACFTSTFLEHFCCKEMADYQSAPSGKDFPSTSTTCWASTQPRYQSYASPTNPALNVEEALQPNAKPGMPIKFLK